MKISKLLIVIIVFLGCGNIVIAQNKNHKHQFYVGTAFSKMGLTYNGTVTTSHQLPDLFIYKTPTSQPALQATYEYRIHQRFSIGVAYSTQRFYEDQIFYALAHNDTIPQQRLDFKAVTTRNDFGVRVLIHAISTERLDIYAAGRYGVNMENFEKNYFNLKTKERTQKSDWQVFQAAVGVRYYVIENVGISIEAAIGEPHFFSTGLNCRF